MESPQARTAMNDINGFNSESIMFASYHLLNNKEISSIYKKYLLIKKDEKKTGSFRKSFQKFIKICSLPLLEHIFSFFDKLDVDFNNFFQLIMFYSFAPNPAVFYVIFQSLPGFEGQVSWHNLAQLTILLRTSSRVDSHKLNIFHKYDLNNDDYLSINQFFNFITQCSDICDNLYQFRQQIIETFFPNKYNLVILNRRLHINMIRDYEIIHNGKLPPATHPSILRNIQPGNVTQEHTYSCCDNFIRKLKNLPHPFKYDYCPVFNIHSSYLELCTIIIKKYNPDFVHFKELFHLKHLTQMSSYPDLNEIGAYYLQYHKMMPRARVKSEDIFSANNYVATSSVSINLSRKSSLQQRQQMYNMKKNVKSILRKSSNSVSKSRKTSIGITPFQKRTFSMSLQNCTIRMNSLCVAQLPNSTDIGSPNNVTSCALFLRSRRGLTLGDSKCCELSNTSFEAIPEIVN